MDSPMSPFIYTSSSDYSNDEKILQVPSAKSRVRTSQSQEAYATPNKRAFISDQSDIFGSTPVSSMSGVKPVFKRTAFMDLSFTSPVQNIREQDVVMMSPTNHLNAFHRSFSESDLAIMNAVSKSQEEPDLIGDFTKGHALPLLPGKQQDLKSISPATLVDLMNGLYSAVIGKYAIVDCRYPYEFEGGHITGAVNIFTKEAILEQFFNENPINDHLIKPPSKASENNGKRIALIFHCEFSSKRGPKLYRFLRQKDREMNRYPNLNYPEIYLLDGGYKNFFEKFQELCEPKTYTPMVADGKALRHFQSKSKAVESRFGRDTSAITFQKRAIL